MSLYVWYWSRTDPFGPCIKDIASYFWHFEVPFSFVQSKCHLSDKACYEIHSLTTCYIKYSWWGLQYWNAQTDRQLYNHGEMRVFLRYWQLVLEQRHCQKNDNTTKLDGSSWKIDFFQSQLTWVNCCMTCRLCMQSNLVVLQNKASIT